MVDLIKGSLNDLRHRKNSKIVTGLKAICREKIGPNQKEKTRFMSNSAFFFPIISKQKRAICPYSLNFIYHGSFRGFSDKDNFKFIRKHHLTVLRKFSNEVPTA